MNSKKACAGRRKPFSGFGGFRVFGSAEAESINAVSRQKTDGVISSARRRSKKEKTIALSAAGTKYAPALLSYICTAEKRVIVAVLGNIRSNAAAPEGFCASLYQTLCKKAGKGQASKGCRKPDCLRPTPTGFRRVFSLPLAAPFYCVRFFLGINGIRLGFATVETLRRFLSDRNREVSSAAKTAQPLPAAPQKAVRRRSRAVGGRDKEGPLCRA